MPPKSTSNVQTFNDFQERGANNQAQDGDEEMAGASAPRGTKRGGSTLTDPPRPRAPPRTSPRNRNNASSAAQATEGQTLGSEEGALVLATNSTQAEDDDQKEEAYEREEALRERLVQGMRNPDDTLPSVVEGNQELKKLHGEIEAKLSIEQGDYYELIDVVRPPKDTLTDAAFRSRVRGGLNPWLLKLNEDKLRVYPDMPQEMREAARHLYDLIQIAAERLIQAGPLSREDFINSVGGELPATKWKPPQPPPGGVVPDGIRSAYDNATAPFTRAWVETRDGLIRNFSRFQAPIQAASAAAFAFSTKTGDQSTYLIRYDDLLGLIRDRTLPGMEKRNIFVFDWILKQYGYPESWLPDQMRRTIEGWQPSAQEQAQLTDAALNESFSIGVTGSRAGGVTRGRINLRGGLLDKPTSRAAKRPTPDKEQGHTELGIIVGIKKRGKGFLVMLNLGTEDTALIVAVPGRELGRNMAQSWFTNPVGLEKGAIGKHSDWAQKKASLKDFDFCSAVVWVSPFDEDDPTLRLPTSYWWVVWQEGVRDEENKLVYPEWLPGSLMIKIIGIKKMIEEYEAFYDRQTEHLAVIRESISNQVHPDTEEKLTRKKKDMMPWLARELDHLDIQDAGQNPKLWETMKIRSRPRKKKKTAKASVKNADGAENADDADTASTGDEGEAMAVEA